MAILDIVIIVVIGLSAIIGLFTGFLAKSFKFVSIVSAAVISYFVATPLNNFFINKDYYQSIYNGLDGNIDLANFLMLIAIFAGVFLISLIILLIILGQIRKVIVNIKIFNILDKVVGFAFGAAVGLFLMCLTLYIIGFLGNKIDSVNEWLTKDLEKSFGLARELFNFTRNLIK